MPKVSIIMPCYNAEEHLAISVGSLFAQSFTDWELIAIDDGSRDGTLLWLQSQHDPRIKVITQSNQGVSAARNRGLGIVTGNYVAFLDADDTWAPTFLEKMIAALEHAPHAVLAYCGWQNVGLPGSPGAPFVPPDYETPDKAQRLFASCRWPIHAALVRGAAIQSHRFNPHLKNAEDYLLWLELAITHPIARVPEVLAFYHFHGGTQASSDRARSALHLLAAQQNYLYRHPEFGEMLGRTTVRQLVFGGLLHAGYECYWARDLVAARTIFRRVMRAAYGKLADWKYMLPALLPYAWHSRLVWLLERQAGESAPTKTK